eukprot:scaffold44244_cov33-Prasinocladus_malaysianus.AAC.2
MLPTLSGPADALRRFAEVEPACHASLSSLAFVQCPDTSRGHRLEPLHKCEHGNQTCRSKSKSKLRTSLIKRPKA